MSEQPSVAGASPDKCPKCGAERWTTSTIGNPCSIYECSSWWETSGGDWYQSDLCRIRELEQVCSDLQKRIDVLEAELT